MHRLLKRCPDDFLRSMLNYNIAPHTVDKENLICNAFLIKKISSSPCYFICGRSNIFPRFKKFIPAIKAYSMTTSCLTSHPTSLLYSTCLAHLQFFFNLHPQYPHQPHRLFYNFFCSNNSQLITKKLCCHGRVLIE